LRLLSCSNLCCSRDYEINTPLIASRANAWHLLASCRAAHARGRAGLHVLSATGASGSAAIDDRGLPEI
jgi:hypothetical protein